MNSVRFSLHVWLRAAILGGLFVLTQLVLDAQKSETIDFSADRYLTHLSTDKPIYRAGERLHARGVVLRADGHSPMTNAPAGAASWFQIQGPKGEIVTSGFATMSDSVLAFSWNIPQDQAGGEYTIRMSPSTGDAPAERKFDIRMYRAPRLKSQIVFARDGYGPGDTVTASVHVERAEGGIPNGARVAVNARVDDSEVWKGTARIDSAGDASVSFKLPAAIARGEGTLGFAIEDGGTLETAARTIPILLQTIDLSTYPEGGDLIAGLENRLYVEARTPNQNQADIAGFVVNEAGRDVAAFRTEHEGRGRVSFTPAKGEKYSVRITEPSGIKARFALPQVKDSGVVLTSASDVIERQEDVVVRVTATDTGVYGVALSQRGKEVSYKRLSLKSGQSSDVTFTVPKTLDGVLVATVYNARKTPVAERLLFRRPDSELKVSVVADQAEYVPGDKVTLRVTTTDESGEAIPAVVGLAVTDSSVLEMIEKRKQAPRLPAMVLIENDVRNLADAHVYLDSSNPKAGLATDLLLGTQGWRRFATIHVAQFLDAHKDAARRVLGLKISPPVAAMRGGFARFIPPIPPYFADDAPVGTEHITGRVTDVTAARIPGVTVYAMNNSTGIVQTVITDETGTYMLRLTPGSYRVTASLPGFQTLSAVALPLQPGRSIRQDFPLQIANANSAVEVSVRDGAPLPPAQAHGVPLPDNMLNGMTIINPDLVGEIRLILQPVDAEMGRGNGTIQITTRSGGGGGAGTMTVREFAHKSATNGPDNSRKDFSETVYWNAALKTDASGVAKVTFNLSDSVTSFRVLADAFAQNGTLGSSTSHVESVQPFSVEPKLPLQVTSGDVIQLPVSIVNGTNRELRNTELGVKANTGIKIRTLNEPQALAAKARPRGVVQLEIAEDFSGEADVTVDAKADRYRDAVTRKLDVQPPGFPHEVSTGGMLERNSSQSFEFTLPNEMVRGSVTSTIAVYPTPLANMTEALKGLVRHPAGCFEQTSATSYPLVMAQQYFLTHSGVDPALIQKTRGLLDGAYRKLLGFQSSSHGYEWFGADPGHEALTAYGLMQFTDMAQVRNVDRDMVARTRAWLLSRRDGKGAFNRNPRALDSFGGAPADTTNAYIIWALMEAGEKSLEKEIARLKDSAASTHDSYIIALAANILHASGDHTSARQLMDRLVKSQHAKGNVQGALTSITRSGGQSLEIETTALSLLAWMKEPAYMSAVQKGLKWIAASNSGGHFGSTQSTILALRSIVAYDKANGRPKAPGRIVLSIDGKTMGIPVPFDTNTHNALVLPQVPAAMGPGKHNVVLRMEDGSTMPFSINLKYSSTLPESSEQAQVGIQVALQDPQIDEGDITEARVSIVNKTDKAIPTPVAIVGIPGGLEVRHDQLRELVKSGKIDAYEVMGREVVLYWRYLEAKDTVGLSLSLIASIPGSYTGPASRAYLYYTDEFKNWAPGLKVSVGMR